MVNLLQPEFVVSAGDMIEGYSDDEVQINAWWQEVEDDLAQLEMPFFFLPGNHDFYSAAAVKAWNERFGNDRGYYHFVYKNTRFLVLDSEDFTDEFFSGLKVKRNEAIAVYKQDPARFGDTEYANMPERSYGVISDAQTAYALETIANNKDARWTFIFMHKPVWKDENESNFKRIEQALGGEKYTVFNGHVHGYQYKQRLGQDYIQLATTGGEMIKSSAKNMDHIMWVTMTPDGPQMGNIALKGLFDRKGLDPDLFGAYDRKGAEAEAPKEDEEKK